MNRPNVVRIVLVLACIILSALIVAACHSQGQSSRMPSTSAMPMARAISDGSPRSLLAEPVLSPGEELWVIQRGPRGDAASGRGDDIPGTGALVCTLPGEGRPVPVPLEHTDVRASIAGFLATTHVTQKFHNPFDTKIEAVYVFPLPENAAVNEFVMSIGERRIRGIIRERDEAERFYKEARAAGHVASLLTQERPNVFTQSVANIEPGRRIDVSIRYYHALAYDDGWFEYVFPMVVGPRFNPSAATGGVGAVPRGGAGESGQDTEVQYLRPGERSGHDIALSVELDARVPAEEIVCATHRTEVHRVGAGRATVRLSPYDSIPNKDFVLRYRVAGEQIRSMFIAHRGDTGGHFALMLIPPADLAAQARLPVEMIFVLDCSGSMSGEPLAQVKDAVRHALSQLSPRDSFQIIRFSDSSSAMGPAPVIATRENIRRGMRYLDSLSGEGGTMMIEGIRAALSVPSAPLSSGDHHRLRTVTFLTDGYIGNETEILAEMRRLLGGARVFSFGVGSSPNRYLMDRMAKLGGGAAAYLSARDDGADIMDRYFARASRPALTDLAIDWDGLAPFDVLPAPTVEGVRPGFPDLLVGRPLLITGRFRGEIPERITIHGRSGGSPRLIEVALGERAATDGPTALAPLWARHKIADLADRSLTGQGVSPEAEIRRLALAHGVVSPFTAFLAVDAATITSGEYGVSVPVAVPVPEGVRYDTTVTGRRHEGGIRVE